MIGNLSTTTSTSSDIHNGNGLSQQGPTSSYVSSLASSSLPLSISSMTGDHLPSDASIDSALDASRFTSILPPHPPNTLQLLHQQQQQQQPTSNLPSASSLASMIQVNSNANKYSTPSSSIIGVPFNDSNGTSTSSTNGNY